MLRCLVEWGMRRIRRRFERSPSLVEWVALDRVTSRVGDLVEGQVMSTASSVAAWNE